MAEYQLKFSWKKDFPIVEEPIIQTKIKQDNTAKVECIKGLAEEVKIKNEEEKEKVEIIEIKF